MSNQRRTTATTFQQEFVQKLITKLECTGKKIRIKLLDSQKDSTSQVSHTSNPNSIPHLASTSLTWKQMILAIKSSIR